MPECCTSAVAKEIYKNISGLRRYLMIDNAADEIFTDGFLQNNRKNQIMSMINRLPDHYAIIDRSGIKCSEKSFSDITESL